MKILSNKETTQVSAAIASMSGSFGWDANGMTFGPNFVLTVTDSSANIMGNFHAYANKVVNAATKDVLFDGSQSSFCINGALFNVSAVTGGHRYKYAGTC